ncbi:hypothetical protein ACEZCY_31600 [Streptacidiphilus sp. N1-12]|uniref:Uncharacterized protein n=2 Tax=Streptacidiphilus alkalitolerans TaxID=3342712 RepID=A0ABV6VJC8_9ACTN
MNIRLAVHLAISMVLGLALALYGLFLAGPFGALLGLVLWFFVENLVKALLPVSYLSSAPGAQATSAMYRGWAPRLFASLGLYRSRNAAGDAARLAAGVRLGVLTFGNHDGSQTLGYLVLRRQQDGQTGAAWRRRGKQFSDRPIKGPLVPAVRPGREQQNSMQARMGFTVSVELGGSSYWVRSSDAELLGLVFPAASAPASAAAQ